MFFLITKFYHFIIQPPANIILDPSKWLFFFAYRQPTSNFNLEIPAGSFATYLPSFGFRKNGTYDIKVVGATAQQYQLFVRKLSENIEFEKVCTESKLNLNTNWKCIVKRKGIYSFYIVDCFRNNSDNYVNIKYLNPKGKGDYREVGIYTLLIVLTITYLVIFILWIINKYMHSQFSIGIHKCMTFLPLLKAFLTFYETRIYDYDKDTVNVKICLLISVITHAFLFGLMGIICAGWSIYTERCKKIDLFVYIVMPLIYFGSSALLNFSSMFFSISFVSFMIYAMKLTFTFSNIKNMLYQIHTHRYKQKLILILSFMHNVLILVFFSSFINILALSLNIMSSIRLLILEGGILMLFISQMYFFFYRTSYDPQDLVTQTELISCIKKNKLFLFLEPKGNILCILNN